MSSENQDNSFTLKELVNIFLLNRKVIIINALITGAIAAIFAFFIIKPVFLSVATVKTFTKAGGLAGLLGEGIPDIGDFSDITGGGGAVAKELALFENILSSRRCVEETIIKFKLNDEWEFKYMEDAVKNFREEVIALDADKLAGTMNIGVYDENPQRAKEIAEFLIYQLNRLNIELNVQNSRNNREFIENRYDIIRTDLKKSEDSLQSYQNTFGIAPDIQVQAATKTQYELEAQIKSEEVKLEILRKILSPDQAEIKAQEEKIAALTNELSEIQNSNYQSGSLTLKESPRVVLDYLRLKRDVEIQNKLLTFILPLYEQAKIEENKEMPSVLILDQPVIPERKAKPKRSVLVAIGMLLGGFGTFGFFLIRDKWNAYKKTL